MQNGHIHFILQWEMYIFNSIFNVLISVDIEECQHNEYNNK